MLKTSRQFMQKVLDLGYEIYIVGGFVRDHILGIPCKDIDLATNCPMDILGNNFTCYDIGKSKDFGILSVVYGNYSFEVAQFRTDSCTSNGRCPDSVSFAEDIYTDLSRRDFTINAMAMDISGVIIDPYGGKKDLEKGVLRFVGNAHERIIEDYLRILRAIRFSAKYNFSVELTTTHFSNYTYELTTKLSPERIWGEIYKAAGTTNFQIYLRELDKHGLLNNILPEANALMFCQEFKDFHPESFCINNKNRGLTATGYNTFTHTLTALEMENIHNKKGIDPALLNLCILFHDIGKPIAKEWDSEKKRFTYHGHDKTAKKPLMELKKRLMLSNEQFGCFMFVCENHMRMGNLKKRKVGKLLTLLRSKYTPYLIGTVIADHCCNTSDGLMEIRQDLDDAEEKIARFEKYLDKDNKFKIVDGNTVMRVCGMKPGKEVGNVIRAVSDYIEQYPEELPTDELIYKIYKEG